MTNVDACHLKPFRKINHALIYDKAGGRSGCRRQVGNQANRLLAEEAADRLLDTSLCARFPAPPRGLASLDSRDTS